MRVFEFHFSPKAKPDLIFDSFCYEPENIYEKKMGSLYIMGLLNNALPQNVRLIKRLAQTIKDKYYRSTIFTPSKALKESLKLANEQLEEITKKGNVSWLGNLSFAILSLKDFKLNFTKIGDIKILLVRGGTIIDIDKKIKLQEIEPYPLKVFSNTVSGKLAEGDLILAFSDNVFDFFQQHKLLDEIAQISSFDSRKLRDVLNGKREDLINISGVFLAISLTKEETLAKKEAILPKDLKDFSLKKIFAPVLKLFPKPKKVPRLIKARVKKARGAPLKIPKIKIPQIIPLKTPWAIFERVRKSIAQKFSSLKLNKNIGLVFIFITILLVGFIISQYEQAKRINAYTLELEEIQEKFNTAESLLLLTEINPQSFHTANLLLKEAWEEISLLSKKSLNLPHSFTVQVIILEDKISQKLLDINKLQQLVNIGALFELDPRTFVPQKMIEKDAHLYLFSPYSQNIFLIQPNQETQIIETEQKINLAAKVNNSIAFFSKPDLLLMLENDRLTSSFLQPPYPELNLQEISSFGSNLYFLDRRAGEIVKYPFLENTTWGSPDAWLEPNTQKPLEADSFSIDGAVWVLKENKILQYYAGRFQRELNFEIFPQPKDFSKIHTSPTLSYFYILEPIQKRIIILDKTGQVVKQFQSELFDNLLDLAVSSDGNTIYLLNGLKVYQINL